MANFTTPDEYIKSFPADVQEILENIRRSIKKVVPDAEEKMGYGVAAFEFKNGRKVYYAAFKKHVGFYPSPEMIDKFQKELSCYKQSKGTIQFQLTESIPYSLIEKIVDDMNKQ